VLPLDRIPRLVEHATRVFIANGFTQTRMEDIAEAVGVAKGTLYRYVESKEALFDLVVRAADRGNVSPELELPIKSPRPGTTVAFIARRLAEERALPAGPSDLATVVGHLFDVLERNRTAIKLLDRTARDVPELGATWSGGVRRNVIESVGKYLQRGMRAGVLREVPDAGIAARFVVETCAFWAVHRHWDNAPIPVPEDRVRASVIELVCAALALPVVGRRRA